MGETRCLLFNAILLGDAVRGAVSFQLLPDEANLSSESGTAFDWHVVRHKLVELSKRLLDSWAFTYLLIGHRLFNYSELAVPKKDLLTVAKRPAVLACGTNLCDYYLRRNYHSDIANVS
ncbi:unnamed protein product [Strongylus vulgaris]|uniref:Uncharacterized protein n=1 Tax=Strongylus vulgaris TaxID=40348 RepID=A0A3P7LB47_STRVU|nr:unnamed protein product [Strongylus vulgaris]